ncbi:MAG TPA: alpha/beta hydrolase family protein [Chitinophaga sp.]
MNKCYCNNYVKIALGILLLFALPIHAQQQPIIDWGGDKLLNAYLMQQLHQHYAIREQKVQKAMQSPAGIQAYQQQLRTAYRQLLGTLPVKTSLQPVVTGHLQQEGYHIEKIVYQSLPGHHVTASLYVPSGKGPFPGLLLFCGHEPEAKATPSYQQTAILLARKGFVVLMIDPVSQGERHQLTDSTGRPLTRGGTTEHTLLNAATALVGSSVAAYELWDNEQGLEYLISRKEVDTTRIGCLGNSGGGTQTAYFMAFDSRIKVAAVCSYITTRERTFELSGPLDGCVQIPNEGKMEMEITDYMHLLAPKPLLVLSGRYDFVDYTGAEQAYSEAKQCYKIFGTADHVQMITVDDGHGISQPKREAAAHWFRKWFYKDDQRVQEAPAVVLPPASLFATRTGEVNSSFPGEVTVQQHILHQAIALSNKRQQFLRNTSAKAFADTLRHLLGITQQRARVQAEEVQPVVGQPQKLLLRCEGEPPLPVVIIRPAPQVAVKEVLIYLHDEGKKKLQDSIALIQSYLQKGYALVLPDLRGMGETADNPEFNHPKFYNKEYRNAIASLHLGRPLMGQRVTDLLILLDYLRAESFLSKSSVTVRASGLSALVALHAAAIDERINRVQADKYLPSFMDINRNVIEKNWYSYVIPGVLRYYDVPDLVRIVDKRFAFP